MANIDSAQKINMSVKTIEQVRQEYTDEWMNIPGVVGTAISQDHGEPCILILTSHNHDQIRAEIPRRIENYPVVVQYTGEMLSR